MLLTLRWCSSRNAWLHYSLFDTAKLSRILETSALPLRETFQNTGIISVTPERNFPEYWNHQRYSWEKLSRILESSALPLRETFQNTGIISVTPERNFPEYWNHQRYPLEKLKCYINSLPVVVLSADSECKINFLCRTVAAYGIWLTPHHMQSHPFLVA